MTQRQRRRIFARWAAISPFHVSVQGGHMPVSNFPGHVGRVWCRLLAFYGLFLGKSSSSWQSGVSAPFVLLVKARLVQPVHTPTES